jgi:MFS transporter, ACS family, hexuronate transporter
MHTALSRRWIAVGIFIISSTLNYLDRQLLAILAPLIMADLHFHQTQYGLLISVLSITYAISSPLAGAFLDRVGVNRGIIAAVAWWSASAAATGFVSGIRSLALCRASLGIGESAGVPAVGKLNGMYLRPGERALGAALNQVGLSLGLMIAPLSIGLATAHSWRTPFVIAGLLGFLWIPAWMVVSRLIPPQFDTEAAVIEKAKRYPVLDVLRDRRLTYLALANVLWMMSYSLWSNWTTLYLIHVDGLTLEQTAHYVWIPPLVSNLGGFFGGWLSLQWMKRRRGAVTARRQAVWVSALGMLLTALLPFAPDARWATACISTSFFFTLAGSVNIYALPIDIFGAARSGLAISVLSFAFGVMQMIISPLIGYMGDHKLYTQVGWLVAIPPVLSALVLRLLPESGPKPDDADIIA